MQLSRLSSTDIKLYFYQYYGYHIRSNNYVQKFLAFHFALLSFLKLIIDEITFPRAIFMSLLNTDMHNLRNTLFLLIRVVQRKYDTLHFSQHR